MYRHLMKLLLAGVAEGTNGELDFFASLVCGEAADLVGSSSS